MDELDYIYLYTPAYSPAYNGIEEVIGMGKAIVKKKRLDKILNNEEESLREIIYSSFRSIDTQSIAKCINRSLEVLHIMKK